MLTIHPWSVLSGIAKSLNWNWKIKIIELCIEGCGEGDLKCLSEKRKPHDKSQITVISTNAKEKSISFLTGQEKSRKFKFCFSNYPKQSPIQNIFMCTLKFRVCSNLFTYYQAPYQNVCFNILLWTLMGFENL